MAGMRALAAVLFGGLCGMAVAATVQGQADVVELEQAEPPTIQASAADLTPGTPRVNDVTSTGDTAWCTVVWLAPPSQLLSHPDAQFIKGYNIKILQKSPAKAFPVMFNNGSASTSTLVSGLMPKHDYTVTIVTLSKDGRQIASQTTAFQTRASVPTAPAAPTITDISYRSLTLRWSAPAGQGEPILKYQLSKQVAGAGDYSPLSQGSSGAPLDYTMTAATEWKVTGLEPNTQYNFKVAAVNKLGKGPDSVKSLPVVTKKSLVPTKPVDLRVKSSDKTRTGLSLTWKAAQGRGEEVSSYRLFQKTSNKGPYEELEVLNEPNILKVAGGYRYRVSNLKPGVAYDFQLNAVNANGIGEAVTTGQVRTDGDAPSKPREILVSNISSSGVRLQWRPPHRTGGAPVTGYRISIQEGGNGGFLEYVKNTNSTKTVRWIKGLKYGGHAYQFQLQAYNQYGLSKGAISTTITTEDDKLASAEKAMTNAHGVAKIYQVAQQLENCKIKEVTARANMDKANALAANALLRARHQKQNYETCKTNAAADEKNAKSQIKATEEDKTRKVAALQRLTDMMVKAEKQNGLTLLSVEQTKFAALAKEFARAKDKNTQLERDKSKLHDTIFYMRKEGCNLGVKKWCDPDEAE